MKKLITPFIAALSCVAALTAAETPKPNLIFILSDDLAQPDVLFYHSRLI